MSRGRFVVSRRFAVAIGIALVILAGVALAERLRPEIRVGTPPPGQRLVDLIPESFGDWRLDRIAEMQIVNPELQANLDAIYTEVLSRTYVDGAGRRIMLSIAYGEDQTDSNQVHRPEICYPAQGFVLFSRATGMLVSGDAKLPVVLLEARRGARHEPVTYWIRVGDRIANGALEKKLVELSHGLRGRIPDGLILRVSSIDRDAVSAHAQQAEFVRALLESVPVSMRARLVGGNPRQKGASS